MLRLLHYLTHCERELTMTPNQIHALRCAYIDLYGLQLQYQVGDMRMADWNGVNDTLRELESSFSALLDDLINDED